MPVCMPPVSTTSGGMPEAQNLEKIVNLGEPNADLAENEETIENLSAEMVAICNNRRWTLLVVRGQLLWLNHSDGALLYSEQ